MTVDVVEELGNETLVYGEVPGEVAAVEIDRDAAAAPARLARPRGARACSGFTDVQPGESAAARPARSTRVHVFDAASGAALAVEAQAAPAS